MYYRRVIIFQLFSKIILIEKSNEKSSDGDLLRLQFRFSLDNYNGVVGTFT